MHLSKTTLTKQTSKMDRIKFLLCFLLIFEVKCDCDTYFLCFDDFLNDFFNVSQIEDVKTDNLPDNFNQVENIPIEELSKVLEEITGFVKGDITNNFKEPKVLTSENGKTKIFIQDLNPNINIEGIFAEEIEKHYQSDTKTKTSSDNDTKTEDLNDQPEQNNAKTEKTSEIVTKTEPTTNKPKEFTKDKAKTEKALKQPEENIKNHLKYSTITEMPTFKEINDNFAPLHKPVKKISYRDFKKDIKENEISLNYDSYYDSLDDNTTDYPIIDYVDLYKDTTNEENFYEGTEPNNIRDIIREETVDYTLEIDDPDDSYTTILSCHGNRSGISQIYPWIGTIFIKNDTTDNQFEYYCDGALLNENVLITSARCVSPDSPVRPEDVLVFLGKRSLQTMTGNEQIVKIKKIRIHENFTKEGKSENDIALLYFEEAVTPTDDFRPACLYEDTNETTVERSATTAWTVPGEMVPVYFINKNTTCNEEDGGGTGGTGTICDSYGLEVPLCASYGGIYVSKLSTGWYLRGIRKADPTERGVCFSKDLQYTPLDIYGEWLADKMEIKV